MKEAYDAEREDYLSLADEMNDPDIGPWVDSHWDTRAVKNGKAYAKKHGLRWPPGTGDFDRYCDAELNGELSQYLGQP